jgi:hypothetical protein
MVVEEMARQQLMLLHLSERRDSTVGMAIGYVLETEESEFESR